MGMMKSSDGTTLTVLRPRLIEFLIHSAHQLQVSPMVKYTALSLFADRFLPSLSRFSGDGKPMDWVFQPQREGNLQLFALISLWISGKIHCRRLFPLKSFKSLGDRTIVDQHFTTRDYLQAEVVLLKVLDYEIGCGNIAFVFLEELLLQLKAVAKVGELVNFEACMDIMDLLYEKEETSLLYSSPRSLAASTLVASYLITVPKQRWEFPILPWVKFVTSWKEEDVAEIVRDILKHVFEPSCKSGN